MKVLNIRIAGILILLFILSCNSTNNLEKLNQLEKKRDDLNEQIRQLKEKNPGDTTSGILVNAPKVAVRVMEPDTFRHFIEVQGQVDGEENLGINARTMGTVESVNVSMGDEVRKGEILASLDDDVLQQNLRQLQDNYKYANELYEKQKNLWDKKIGSEVQYLTAKNNKETIENNIKSLKDQIDKTKITSPINGSVEWVGIKIGQSVSPGVPVFRVINFNSVKVVAEISEFYSDRVNKGDEVEIDLPDLQKKIAADITSASKYINPQNRTFEIEVRLTPGNNHYKANMVAVVRINDYVNDKAMILPVNLVQKDNKGSYVLVATRNSSGYSATKVRVKTGESYNGMVEITEGLRTGDKVITTNQNNLEEGQAIRV